MHGAITACTVQRSMKESPEMARDDKAITFRPGEPYYDAIKAGITRTGLPEGHAITQVLLAAFGESELLETLQRARDEAGAEPASKKRIRRR